MSSLTELKFSADRPIGWRFFVTANEKCRAGLNAVARIVRVRRDRALLDELPDHLLRDIGISRLEIRLATSFGRRYSDRTEI
jgi:uncharacterized protein YjiS (DUF1127 family)